MIYLDARAVWVKSASFLASAPLALLIKNLNIWATVKSIGGERAGNREIATDNQTGRKRNRLKEKMLYQGSIAFWVKIALISSVRARDTREDRTYLTIASLLTSPSSSSSLGSGRLGLGGSSGGYSSQLHMGKFLTPHFAPAALSSEGSQLVHDDL